MRRRELLGGLIGFAFGCGRRAVVDEAERQRDSPVTVEPRTRVRVLSYNVLADEVAVERRIPALMRVMERARPDVLALQEVAPWFLDQMAAREWLRSFEIAQIDGRLARPNGQLIASRLPTRATRSRRLPGEQPERSGVNTSARSKRAASQWSSTAVAPVSVRTP